VRSFRARRFERTVSLALGHSCIPTAGRSLPVYYSQFQTFRCNALTDALGFLRLSRSVNYVQIILAIEDPHLWCGGVKTSSQAKKFGPRFHSHNER
jgi:hypothetical protein